MRKVFENILITTLLFCASVIIAGQFPKDFVYIQDIIPDIILEMRYCSNKNFTGRIVDGYVKPKAILTLEAVKKLKEVQDELRSYNLSLKIFDAHRPQKAVDFFIKWANSPEDYKTKALYYPKEAKKNLFKDGYIAPKSSHTRGSTVDLTLVYINKNKQTIEFDMGSPFDYFGKESWSNYVNISPQQRANRLLLKTMMEKHGFESYPYEWWHYTLKNEPFPDIYFNFPVE